MSAYGDQLLVDASIAVLLAVGLGVTYGHGGFLSLCHATFFGVGAWCAALLSAWMVAHGGHPSLAISICAGIAGSMLFASIVGAICSQLRGDFIALATLAFGELARALALNIYALGGPHGIRGIARLTTPSAAVVLAILGILAARFYLQSPWGRLMEATRDNPSWATSLAIPAQKAKFSGLVFGAALAGIAGALFAHYEQYLYPNSFDLMASVTVLLAVILGGRGNLTGYVIGALVVSMMPEVLRMSLPGSADWRVLCVGLLLLLTAIMWPDGLLGRWPYRDPIRRAFQWHPRVAGEVGAGHSGETTDGALKVENLTVRALGSAILQDVSLEAPAGITLAIIGPNGSGKSTLGRALAGDLPSDGTCRIGGRSIGLYPRKFVDRRIMLCTTQHPFGFQNMNALDNVRVAYDRDTRISPWISWLPFIGDKEGERSSVAALEALSGVGLADRRNILFKIMSYGQRKRTIIAASLLAAPRVLILDEPFAGLNVMPGGEAEIILKSLKDRFASESYINLIIDHRVGLLQDVCDTAILIDGGRVVYHGPLGNLVKSREFEEIYGTGP